MCGRLMRHAMWLAALLLMACTHTPTSTELVQVNSAALALDASALSRWRAQGRLGVVTPDQSGSGAFSWQQTAADSEATIRGPAGIGALQLRMQAGVLTLRTGDGLQVDSDAALAALEQRLGVALPVAAWPYWLRGLSAPGAAQWLDETHTSLSQQGWQIRYEQWVERGRLRLPLRITMISGALRVTIKLQEWRVDG